MHTRRCARYVTWTRARELDGVDDIEASPDPELDDDQTGNAGPSSKRRRTGDAEVDFLEENQLYAYDDTIAVDLEQSGVVDAASTTLEEKQTTVTVRDRSVVIIYIYLFLEFLDIDTSS